MYLVSLGHTQQEYRSALGEAWTEHLNLPNKDFDTGRETRAGEYVLTDKAYARLLDELAKQHFTTVSAPLRSDILSFYANPNAPIATKHDKKKWERTMAELNQLKSAPINPQPATPATGGQN